MPKCIILYVGRSYLEVAEFCLFNQDFGRKYVWSCGTLSFPASGSPNRGRGIPVIVIETFHDGKPFPALKKMKGVIWTVPSPYMQSGLIE